MMKRRMFIVISTAHFNSNIHSNMLEHNTIGYILLNTLHNKLL